MTSFPLNAKVICQGKNHQSYKMLKHWNYQQNVWRVLGSVWSNRTVTPVTPVTPGSIDITARHTPTLQQNIAMLVKVIEDSSISLGMSVAFLSKQSEGDIIFNDSNYQDTSRACLIIFSCDYSLVSGMLHRCT